MDVGQANVIDCVVDRVVDRVITRALGDELQRTREDRGLSQAQLVARMPSNLNAKTLASYEQGARACTVVRLCEIARALGASPVEILERALHRAELDTQMVRLHIDLHALVHDTRPELKQLRRWARARLAAYPTNTLARLDGGALQEMAVFLETTPTGLISQLAMFTPNTATRH